MNSMEIFFMKDIIEQFGAIVAVSDTLEDVVAWNGDDVFYLFETRTFDGEYVKMHEHMSQVINATDDVGSVIEYAMRWLGEDFE